MKGSISGRVTEKYLPAPREREAEYRAFRHQKYSFSHRKTKSLFTEMSRRGARSPHPPSSRTPLPPCRRGREGGQSRHINRTFSPHSQPLNHSAQAPYPVVFPIKQAGGSYAHSRPSFSYTIYIIVRSSDTMQDEAQQESYSRTSTKEMRPGSPQGRSRAHP